MPEQPQIVTKLTGLAPRRRDGHKGDYGRVLVAGGSRGMIGAVALAANAALRGGAGLVTFAAPGEVQLTIAALCPCATSVPLACDSAGLLAPESVRELMAAAGGCDVLAVGPGMGQGSGQLNLVLAALEQGKPLVLDADGLNNLVRADGWPGRRQCPLVLTPHPGEFARLTGKSVEEIQADRQSAATDAVKAWAGRSARQGLPLVCSLKGAGTVVTDGKRAYVNRTGNPGMATGGTGDVLTGLVAAFLAQGLEPFEAACLAVHTHGRAGDLAAAKLGEAPMIAWDLLEFLPAAMKEAVG
jgi:NAD(P)H-hydrate epimerase